MWLYIYSFFVAHSENDVYQYFRISGRATIQILSHMNAKSLLIHGADAANEFSCLGDELYWSFGIGKKVFHSV